LTNRQVAIEKYVVTFMQHWAHEMRLRGVEFRQDVSSNIGAIARAQAETMFEMGILK
jgi:hypothetical protein